MKVELNAEKIAALLNAAYDKALVGFPGSDTPQALAAHYLAEKAGDAEAAIDALIKWQAAKCSASGFVTGLGGILTLPVAVPADLAVTFYINVRMVAAIAHLRGYDLRDEATRTAVFLCLVGASASEVMGQAGVESGAKLSKAMLRKIPNVIRSKLHKSIALKLTGRFGNRGILGFTKLAPLIGGVVSGAANGAGCAAIGHTAKATLLS